VLRGHVLSHDQIEAALMRRGGYDVRVLPEENLGWEENPPTLIEFIRRDLRWLQGTLQYAVLLVPPRLKFVSRFQLAFAMMMFIGSPAWIGLLIVGTLAIASSPSMTDFIPRRRGLYATRRLRGDVVHAEDRNRHRRAGAAGPAPRVRGDAAVPR